MRIPRLQHVDYRQDKIWNGRVTVTRLIDERIRGESLCDKDIVGAWKLISSNRREHEDKTIVKVFSESDFAWIRLNSRADRAEAMIFGTYTYDGYQSEIKEVPKYAVPRMGIVNVLQQYEVFVDNNVLNTEGHRSPSNEFYKEEFHRIDWNLPLV